MKYYVYFDSYGHPGDVIDETRLAKEYHNDPDEFLKSVYSRGSKGQGPPATGHVGTLRFDTEEELKDYLRSLGDEITGFYGCRSESRPYNF